ncbi:MAG: segregation/condensation protein A [Actinomycetia bacterium]|nr:segregation/condensation protein A [Actinomycetes bacterium]
MTSTTTDVPEPGSTSGFHVRLDVFEGPFDLLLSLIAKHKLDVTEVALGEVTDEFISYIKAAGEEWDLEQTTHFLVVAATLLDLKTARLLPSAEVEDEDDLALLEARDLLFARLLQYRAYKTAAAELARIMAVAGRSYPRAVGLEPQFASLLPEVLLGIGADGLAALAGKALAPKVVPEVAIGHIHAPPVSVKEQAALLVDRLRRVRTASFRGLVGDAADTMTVIARFLALLELFREGAVAFDQVQPLAELTVRWTGSDDGELDLHDEFDDDDQSAAAGTAEEPAVEEPDDPQPSEEA